MCVCVCVYICVCVCVCVCVLLYPFKEKGSLEKKASNRKIIKEFIPTLTNVNFFFLFQNPFLFTSYIHELRIYICV